ncbi:MAG: twin-arginine translocation signal domain-containing protein, partial [Candidatus Hydrogenedentes bacterium]|nr:twin-arginine translocation signal domain-containing protein [Candidatus Hydrogenedentota bacterium]
MTMKFTRRSFLKSAGTATGVMIATGFSPFTYAQNEKVRLGVIGTGGQGNIHIRGGLAGTPDIEIMAVCDIYPPHLQAGQIYGWFSNAKLVDFEIPARPTDGLRERMRQVRKPNAYADYHEMLEKEPLDAVLIATP